MSDLNTKPKRSRPLFDPNPDSTHTNPPAPVILSAKGSDIPHLIDIDVAASSLFAPTGLLSKEALLDHVPESEFRQAISNDWLYKAVIEGGVVAGFVMASIREQTVYVEQLSVKPSHGRRGVGRALMEALEKKAMRRGHKEMTLSTFRELPWNGPFYESLGFRHLPRKSFKPFMLELEAAQAPLMDISKRTFMRKRLRRPLFGVRKTS